MTIPKEVQQRLGWKPGTEVLVEIADGRVVVMTAEQRIKDLVAARDRAIATAFPLSVAS